jgi:hypothetical protein
MFFSIFWKIAQPPARLLPSSLQRCRARTRQRYSVRRAQTRHPLLHVPPGSVLDMADVTATTFPSCATHTHPSVHRCWQTRVSICTASLHSGDVGHSYVQYWCFDLWNNNSFKSIYQGSDFTTYDEVRYTILVYSLCFGVMLASFLSKSC